MVRLQGALLGCPSLAQRLSIRQVPTHCWINRNISSSARNQEWRVCRRLLTDSEGEVEGKKKREEVRVAVALAVLRMLKMGEEEEEKRRKKGTVRRTGKDVQVLCLSCFTPVFCQGFNLTLLLPLTICLSPSYIHTNTHTDTLSL